MSLREAFEHSMNICEQDLAYLEYSAREKFLAFTFTYIQTMQHESNKFIPLLKNKNIFIFPNDEIKRLKHTFDIFSSSIIDNGIQNNEIVDRPIISKMYPQILWNCMLNILHFWATDKSNNKEETDVIIEKSVHFSFDLLSPNAIDSGIDVAKFLLQKR